MAFMTHLQETGKPLDNYRTDIESVCFLTGAFFPSSSFVPNMYWLRFHRRADLDGDDPGIQDSDRGSRSSVMI
jgi:hypothetical protein